MPTMSLIFVIVVFFLLLLLEVDETERAIVWSLRHYIIHILANTVIHTTYTSIAFYLIIISIHFYMATVAVQSQIIWKSVKTLTPSAKHVQVLNDYRYKAYPECIFLHTNCWKWSCRPILNKVTNNIRKPKIGLISGDVISDLFWNRSFCFIF